MQVINKCIVFENGQDGYAGYRIPSLVKAADGSSLAFCEARKNDLKDYGHIDIVMKRSNDGGMTWSKQHIIVSDGENTFGNCCCVLDSETSIIHMVYNFNHADASEEKIKQGSANRKAYYLYSKDNGFTWSKPREITKSVYKKEWGWLAFGPCHGIKTQSGCIMFPANHSDISDKVFHSYAIYTDDGGKNFGMGDDVGKNTNECALAQLEDGRIY